ncbi:olee1-like protein [Gastrolobium bilobum]|uniref:olee1-like protein n=1 Tax=Gastrolobium bilobum TaxID=150636 RepID=UPI002AAF56EF|nr:olee1-like protein [Gastrolobium bilobum]
MAKSTIILVSALCFLSFFGSVHCKERFFVEGVVYCDTCRIQFLTKLSELLEGATVRVECKEEESGNVTFTKEAVTDASGSYKVEVDGDHEEEVCEVVLVKSPRKDCSEVDRESHLEQAARISITNNAGIVSPVRKANPLGFLKKERLPSCGNLLKELGMNEDGSLI